MLLFPTNGFISILRSDCSNELLLQANYFLFCFQKGNKKTEKRRRKNKIINSDEMGTCCLLKALQILDLTISLKLLTYFPFHALDFVHYLNSNFHVLRLCHTNLCIWACYRSPLNIPIEGDGERERKKTMPL